MSENLERAVSEARARLRASDFRDRAAFAEVHAAERRLAESDGGEWAEAIDLGARWDIGAPLPHLVSNGSSATLVCHAAVNDPNWDGTNVRMVSPTDAEVEQFLLLRFIGCHSIKFGGPNDEVMHGHPLSERGLEPYSAHVVHRSHWLESERKINSVHPYHSDEAYRKLNHYLLAFHDETFEALARSIEVTEMQGALETLLLDASRALVRG